LAVYKTFLQPIFAFLFLRRFRPSDALKVQYTIRVSSQSQSNNSKLLQNKGMAYLRFGNPKHKIAGESHPYSLKNTPQP
jgi:hypothetical protein